MTTIKSRKDLLFITIYVIVFTFNLYITYSIITRTIINIEDYIGLVAIAILNLFLLWIFTGTKYQIDNTTLKYFSGPIRGEIDIRTITKIEKGKTMWTGMRPAMARKGIIIYYGKFNSIYISPESNEAFTKYLLKINPDITIS